MQLAQWLQERAADQPASVSLINNAGVIPAVMPLHSSDAAELAHALRVGLEAPVVMSSTFLAATQDWLGFRRVLNISSGLGRRPMASQAAYCAAKAGLDHFTRCMALDEARLPNGARVCSLAPGVIDTDMQLQLRSAAPTQFPDQTRFAELKQLGQLSSPQEAARQVLAYLNRTDFGDQPVADVCN
jgi:NAD(P)-dependent dehydrogenase (short-subunit alcohol dehydrogenase family)